MAWLSFARGEAVSPPDSLLFPWERGFLGVVFGHRDPITLWGSRGVDVPVRVEPALQQPEQPAPTAEPTAVDWQPWGVCRSARVPRLRGTQPVDEDRRRGLAVSRWRWILEVAGATSEMFKQSAGQSEESLGRALVDACYT